MRHQLSVDRCFSREGYNQTEIVAWNTTSKRHSNANGVTQPRRGHQSAKRITAIRSVVWREHCEYRVTSQQGGDAIATGLSSETHLIDIRRKTPIDWGKQPALPAVSAEIKHQWTSVIRHQVYIEKRKLQNCPQPPAKE